jgi:beta-glucosidase
MIMAGVQRQQAGPLGLVASLLLGTASIGFAQAPTQAAPTTTASSPASVRWPAVRSEVPRDARTAARVKQLLAGMSVEEKVGQIIQPDIASITPEDVARYKFGSILAGGNSSPGGNEKAPAAEWLKLADAYWNASDKAAWSGPKIPLMWGIDAVHGHANVVGATIFPQNIGLGATRDPTLMRKIGEVTAREMVITGLDWDFSPTLAVVRNDRWGRSYEGFSEEPTVVRSFAAEMVHGLQGRPGTPDFLGAGRVIATAKHFVGDGGTDAGKDQGDTLASPQELRDIHGAGYAPAIEAGVQAVMASFSSVRGEKVHGSKALLDDVLKQQMRFDGLVVGDWNAHGQVPGCTNTSCPQSINAGLDMFMAPDSWKELYANTLKQVRSGEIPMARLDDAVGRILTVKLRAGLFDKGAPSTRPLAGRFELLGSAEHRSVAREAVRKSLVLLKNNGSILPLSPGANILVAGDGADNISKQSGGWTISWQGSGLTNADFPGATSIWKGIDEAVRAGGGRATLSPDGSYTGKPDAAIVVFGEEPYAEFVGDRATLEFSPGDKTHLDLLRKLKAAGIPTVAVFLSGRPLWVNLELNSSDAFVAAFLPGSEGAGVADVLIGDRNRRARHDFRGKLSFSWPKRADGATLNVGDRGYNPLFPFGYGLTYASRTTLPRLAEDRPPPVPGGADGVFFGRGALPPGWAWASSGAGMTITALDRRAQEDARGFRWIGGTQAQASIRTAAPIDISRETTGELSLLVDYRVDERPGSAVTLAMDSAQVPIGGILRSAPLGEWRTLTVPLRCFAQAGLDARKVTVPASISTAGTLQLSISDVRVASAMVPQNVCGQN